MMVTSSSKLRRWESALIMAAALTLTIGVWAGASESALAGQVLRLHVVANSDSAEDQALKLEVRDAVLAQASQLLEGIEDRNGAEEALGPHLDELAQTGAQVLAGAGSKDRVAVTLDDQWFPTKVYEGFSLPAGRYRALRVVIGRGAGQNWWCVVFPPLCLGSVTEEVAETAAQAGMGDEQISLITGQDGGYVLKFKVIEWWQELLQRFGG